MLFCFCGVDFATDKWPSVDVRVGQSKSLVELETNEQNMATNDVTAAELAILEELWKVGKSSIKELAQTLYGASTPSDIATVQKLLGRLEGKECVGRNRETWPNEFYATIDRDALIGHRLQVTADQLCDGTMGTLLTHLVQSQKLNGRERQRLRKLLDELDTKKQ